MFNSHIEISFDSLDEDTNPMECESGLQVFLRVL
jgi:hypothetical protein